MIESNTDTDTEKELEMSDTVNNNTDARRIARHPYGRVSAKDSPLVRDAKNDLKAALKAYVSAFDGGSHPTRITLLGENLVAARTRLDLVHRAQSPTESTVAPVRYIIPEAVPARHLIYAMDSRAGDFDPDTVVYVANPDLAQDIAQQLADDLYDTPGRYAMRVQLAYNGERRTVLPSALKTRWDNS